MGDQLVAEAATYTTNTILGIESAVLGIMRPLTFSFHHTATEVGCHNFICNFNYLIAIVCLVVRNNVVLAVVGKP
jgi:hypothetical protein